MENKKEPARKPADRKNSALNNNVVWYLLALGVLTLLVVSLLTNVAEEVIPMSDLIKLVKIKKNADRWGSHRIDHFGLQQLSPRDDCPELALSDRVSRGN